MLLQISDNTINPVSVLVIGNNAPGNECNGKPLSNSYEKSICRICHCGDGDTDSVLNREADKLSKSEQNPGLTYITLASSESLNSPSRSPPSSLPSPASSAQTTTTTAPSSKSIRQMTLITPCCCSGSLKYVHHDCLQQWIRSSGHQYCELCKYQYKMSVKYKPFYRVSLLAINVQIKKKILLMDNVSFYSH